MTVSNYRFSNTFPYGLTINPTTGLLSGTLPSTLPDTVSFTLLGSAGIVDGSLGGTMTTANLTVNRAQILRNDYDALANSNTVTLRIYKSDNNGATWSIAHSDCNVYASTIATNGSTLYYVPTTSNFLLTSSNGASYTRRIYDDAAATPHVSTILNKPGTTTWWMVGTRATSPSTRGAFLYTSTDDGVTWRSTAVTTGGFTARDGNQDLFSTFWSPYVTGGAALAYKDGVLLLGGNRILRSTDDGLNWATVVGGFTTEVATFSVAHETVWVATGSDAYRTGSTPEDPYNTPTTTIYYSIDAGLSWTAATGGFNVNGYDLQYGRGAWMAIGLNNAVNYRLQVRYSFDGATWTLLSAVPSPAIVLSDTSRPQSLFQLGSLAFDETEWKVIETLATPGATLYSHPYDLPMEIGWTTTDITGSFASLTADTRFASYVEQIIDPGADVTTITFPLPNTGPTFVSPAQSTYVVWQYMPVPPITFTAAGTGIGYFVSALPVGLTWNAATRSVSGAPMRTGTQTFTVYAKNSGLSAFTVTLIVEVPRIIKQQSGAGAYTSLVRQYTEVNAAQNARDSHVLPNESRTLGEFASPYPPSVVTPSNCPC
jgi:hypothetical protein